MALHKIESNDISIVNALKKIDTENSIKSEMSVKILNQIKKSAEEAMSSSDNDKLISIKERNKILKSIVKQYAEDDNEKKKLYEAIDEVNKYVKQNSSVTKYLSSKVKESAKEKISSKFDEIKQNAFNSLPAPVRGLISFGKGIYDRRKDAKEKVLEEVLSSMKDRKSDEDAPQKDENVKKAKSYYELESQETYQKNTIDVQEEINENILKIYDFLSGKEFSKKLSESISAEGNGGGFLSSLFDGLKNLAIAKVFGNALSNFKRRLPRPLANVIPDIKNTQDVNVKKNDLGKADLKDIGKTSSKEVEKTISKEVGKEVSESAGKTAAKSAGKTGAKGLAKKVGEKVLKKVPFLGTLLSAGSALGRFSKGDMLGGGIELASGLAAMVPLIGTGVSIALDSALIARDSGLFDEEDDEAKKKIDELKESLGDEEFSRITRWQNEKYGEERINERMNQGYGFIDGDLSKYGDHIKETVTHEKDGTAVINYSGFKSKEEEDAFWEDKIQNINQERGLGLHVVETSGREVPLGEYIREKKKENREKKFGENFRLLSSNLSEKDMESIMKDQSSKFGEERISERLNQGYGLVDGDLSKYGDHIKKTVEDSGDGYARTVYTGFKNDEERKAFFEDYRVNSANKASSGNFGTMINMGNNEQMSLTDFMERAKSEKSKSNIDGLTSPELSEEKYSNIAHNNISGQDKSLQAGMNPSREQNSLFNSETNNNERKIVNNFNTVNTSNISHTVGTRSPQILVNPMNQSVWQGAGWVGAR